MTKVIVKSKICSKTHIIDVTMDDDGDLAVKIESDCDNVNSYAKLLGDKLTMADVTEELGGDDPIEPFNRSMFAVNDVLMQYLVCPISWVYGSILPEQVIRRIDMASDNLAFPGRMVSCFLQAKWKYGGTEFTYDASGRRLGKKKDGTVITLVEPTDYKTRHFIKVQSGKNPFAPQDRQYFEQREKTKVILATNL